MSKIRILAVEDEEIHADILQMTIEKLGYDLIAIVDNATETLALIKATKPDILLIDIDIQGDLNGVELVSKINEIADIPVIYITSHKDIEVFSLAKNTLPESYLTKPYNAFQLQAAIELAMIKRKKEVSTIQKANSELVADGAVYIKEGKEFYKICVKDILLIEAYDKYCFAYTKEKKHLINATLKAFSGKLPAEQFMQVHRSFVININAIEKVVLGQNTLQVAGKSIPVSKSYKSKVFSNLKMI